MQGKILIIMFGGAGIIYGASMAERAINYTEVQGTVKKAEIDCFVKSGKRSLVEKETDNLAYMDCDMAPLIAVQFGYDESDVKQRAKFTYQYTSPVDGSLQEDKAERDGSVGMYQKGSSLTVYAHNDEPTKSRLH